MCNLTEHLMVPKMMETDNFGRRCLSRVTKVQSHFGVALVDLLNRQIHRRSGNTTIKWNAK